MFCGKALSPGGAYKASFVLAASADGADRHARVFLCDQSSNCDVVFVGAADRPLFLAWRGASTLVIRSEAGSLQAPGAIVSTGTGRPPVATVHEKADVPAAQRQLWYSFQPEKCASQPPIGAKRLTGSFGGGKRQGEA
jgi:hypothetical protein